MRRIALTAVLALTASLALVANAAAAVTCSYPAAAYGAPSSGSPGPTNDPLSSLQWGYGQIKAPPAWAAGYQGSGVVVAVLDTGADLAHPDLAPNLVPGTDLDKSVDAGPGEEQLPPGGECPGPQDENGHGTHVSGTVAAVNNNGLGVAGTATLAKVMPVRVLDARGAGNLDSIVEGIRYAADNGARVINMSLGEDPIVGQSEALNEDLEAAIDYAYSKGAVTVAAAGNESFPACSYPSAAQRAVCVAATDPDGRPSYYSNFPVDPDGTIALRAPGGEGTFFCRDDVYSTYWPGGEDADSVCAESPGYVALAGTSMAAPHVSGVAALLAAKGLSAGQILECLRTTSSKKGAYDPVYGYGIVDADSATKTCSPAATSTFTPPPAAVGGGGTQPVGTPPRNAAADTFSVTVRRTSRAQLAKTGRIKVVVRSSKAAKVGLRAVYRRSSRARKRTGAKRTVSLTRAGTKTFTLRLSRAARRDFKRYKRPVLVVRYRSGERSGTARPS